MIKFFVFLILLGVLAFAVYDSIIDVPDGSVGVVTFRRAHLGPIPTSPRILQPGLHLTLPVLARYQTYNTRLQTILLDVPIAPGNTFRLTAQVRLDPDSAVYVHMRLGPSYLKEYPIRLSLTAYMQNEIYATRGDILDANSQQRLLQTITSEFARNGLILDEAILTRLGKIDLKPEHRDTSESDTDEDGN